MEILSLFLVMVQAVPDSSAQGHGWQGNQYLQENLLQQAQKSYEQGLTQYQDGRSPDGIYYGLQNNLGIALHGQGDLDGAEQAFNEAVSTASGPPDLTRSLYNAGNSAFSAQANERALEHYRRALLADPQNEDARFNYEYVKRLQQQQEEEQQNQEQGDQGQDQQNQEQESQGEQNQNEQSQDEQNQQNQEQQSQDQQQEQQQEPSPDEEQPRQTPMSRAEAERILQALENEEKELLREVQKAEGRPRRVTKDW